MKKFGEYIEESLALQVKSEPKTAASKEAKMMGLTYMGFGRYADKKGNLAYIVHNDRLVPYKSRDDVDMMYYQASNAQMKEPKVNKKNLSVKGKPPAPSKAQMIKQEADVYNKALNTRSKEDQKILKDLYKDADSVDRELFKFYKPNLFDESELAALEEYTGDGYQPINKYLYKGHDNGVSPEEDEYITSNINAIDSAFEDTQVPFSYTVYSGLSSRYSADKFQIGGEYLFRGYVSTTLDFNTAIGSFADVGSNEQPVVLQIELKKGQKAIYVDAVSQHEGERETLLPRGSKVKVVSGPHILDSALFTDSYVAGTIALFHCVLVEDL